MKHFIDTFLIAIREKKSYLFVALPFALIILALTAFIAVFQEPVQQQKPVIATPTLIPTEEPEPTEEIPLTPEATIPPETALLLQKQAETEKQHAEEQAAIQRNYPWFNQLPIDKVNYFVYFDAEIEAFVGLLYPETSSSIPVATQVEQLKTSATFDLEEMEIPWQSYPFNWKINPE